MRSDDEVRDDLQKADNFAALLKIEIELLLDIRGVLVADQERALANQGKAEEIREQIMQHMSDLKSFLIGEPFHIPLDPPDPPPEKQS